MITGNYDNYGGGRSYGGGSSSSHRDRRDDRRGTSRTDRDKRGSDNSRDKRKDHKDDRSSSRSVSWAQDRFSNDDEAFIVINGILLCVLDELQNYSSKSSGGHWNQGSSYNRSNDMSNSRGYGSSYGMSMVCVCLASF